MSGYQPYCDTAEFVLYCGIVATLRDLLRAVIGAIVKAAQSCATE